MNLNNALLKKVSTHFVGNKHNEQELILSNDPLNLEEGMLDRLKDYFLSKIGNMHDRYHFSHPSSLEYNEVYCFVAEILKEGNSFS